MRGAEGAAGGGGEPLHDRRHALGVLLRSMRDHGGPLLVRAPVLVVAGSLLEGAGLLLLVPAISVLAGGSTAPPWLERRLALLPVARTSLLPVLFAGTLLLVALRGVVLRHRDQTTYHLALATVDGWRERMVRALAEADWPHLSGLKHNRIEHAVTTDVTRLAGGGDQLIRGGSALLQVLVQAGFAFLLSPRLAFVAFLPPLALLPFLRRIMAAGDRHGRLVTKGGWRRHDAFGAFLSGLKLAKAHDLEERYAREFAAAGAALTRQALDFNGARLRLVHGFRLAGTAAAVALAAVGLYGMHVPVAVLTALLLLLARLSGPVTELAQGVQGLGTLLPVVSNLLDILDELGPGRARSPVVVRPPPLSTPAAVALHDASYGHGRARPLTHLHFRLDPGEAVALVGASGAGKTTVADMLIGLAPPDKGMLVVDGVPLADEEGRRAWRAQTAYVPQDPMLFDMPLADNLRWAAPDASDEEIWAALDVVGAAALVRSLSDGLSTRAGHRGTRLSGGERQRLCLARALLKRPRLLLLDEATSALDPAAERVLLERLRAGTRASLLVIAHRPPPRPVIDRTVMLDNGRLFDV